LDATRASPLPTASYARAPFGVRRTDLVTVNGDPKFRPGLQRKRFCWSGAIVAFNHRDYGNAPATFGILLLLPAEALKRIEA
jgi:hypothetical protein